MNTLADFAQHLAAMFAPLRNALVDEGAFRALLYRLGWRVKGIPDSYGSLFTALDAAVQAAAAIGKDPGAEQVAQLLQRLKEAVDAIKAVKTAPEGVDGTAFLASFGERVLTLLLVDHLCDELPGVYQGLRATGLLTVQFHAEDAGRPAFLETSIDYERIAHVLSHPDEIAATVFGWGTADFNFSYFSDILLEVVAALGWEPWTVGVDHERRGGYAMGGAALARAVRASVFDGLVGDARAKLAIDFVELHGDRARLPGFVIEPAIPRELGTSIPLTKELTLDIHAGIEPGTIVGIAVRPTGVELIYPFAPDTPLPAAGIETTLTYDTGTPAVLIGSKDASRLEARGATVGLSVDRREGAPPDDWELVGSVEANALQLVFATKDQDGLWGTVFGGADVSIPIPLGLRWSSKTGPAFIGGNGFSVQSTSHFDIGPVRVDGLAVALSGDKTERDEPRLRAKATLGLQVTLGPVKIRAGGLGIGLDLTFAKGNLGIFDLSLGFVPPTQLGIAIDAGPISGGGFLAVEEVKDGKGTHGRYSGLIELEVFGIAVKAIGILDTRLPSGEPGFSFLILITAQFTPIQLGYGFTLQGVGGLLGIHRTAQIEALRGELRSGGLGSILFPKDLVGEAPTILSRLNAFFPPADGRYLFGPAALIGWGTPTLLTIQLALILELPSPARLIVLGRLHAALPSQDKPLVTLNMDAIGVIEFDEQRAALDAVLYDSQIVGLALTGEMAMRMSWGKDPSFLLAVGGFHPKFRPPPGFPRLRRIGLTVGNLPRLRFEAYLALTSNTAQVGARVDLVYKAAGLSIEAAAGFDALFQFAPHLHFEAEIFAHAAIKYQGFSFASVSLHFDLSGPSPWHARGKARVSLLFFSATVSFNKTFGSAQQSSSTFDAVDVTKELVDAFEEHRNWSGAVRPGQHTLVALRDTPLKDVVLVHPEGELTVRQRVAPLGVQITKFGVSPVVESRKYTLASVELSDTAGVSGTSFAPERLDDWFAPAQFFEMADAQKLSRPSFESMQAGARLSPATPQVGNVSLDEVAVEYDLRVFDPIGAQVPQDTASPVTPEMMDHMLESGAAARAPLRTASRDRYRVRGPRIRVKPDIVHTIARTSDLGIPIEPALDVSGTYTEVQQALEQYLIDNPDQADSFQVVGRHELEGA